MKVRVWSTSVKVSTSRRDKLFEKVLPNPMTRNGNAPEGVRTAANHAGLAGEICGMTIPWVVLAYGA